MRLREEKKGKEEEKREKRKKREKRRERREREKRRERREREKRRERREREKREGREEREREGGKKRVTIWRSGASIPVPPACEAGALPFELLPLPAGGVSDGQGTAYPLSVRGRFVFFLLNRHVCYGRGTSSL